MTSKASSAPTTEKPAAVTANMAKQAKQETPAPSRSRFSACWESHSSKKKMEKPSTEQPEPGTAAGAKEPIKQKTGDLTKGSDAPHRAIYFKDKSKWERYLKDSKKTCQLIVINFTTMWSVPCIEANTGIATLSEIYQDVKFAYVDIDYLLDVTKAFKVKWMPTFVLLKKDSSFDEGPQKGQESGNDKQENASHAKEGKSNKKVTEKGEKENFMTVAKLEGWKKDRKTFDDLVCEIEKRRYIGIRS